MSVPSFSPNLVRIIGVVTVVVTLSAIASAQRYGGSGQSTPRVSAPPQAGQTAPASSGRGTQQNRSGQEFSLSWEWWKDDAARKEMKLSDQQVRSISRLYDNRVRTLKPVAEEIVKQRDILNKMTQERTVDVPVYAIQVNHLEALRSEMNRTRTIMLYEIHKSLTPEQTLKLGEILERRRKARGSGGQR